MYMLSILKKIKSNFECLKLPMLFSGSILITRIKIEAAARTKMVPVA